MSTDETDLVPLEDDDVEEDEYNVEDIRAERRNAKTGVLEYLIKWENYPESQNTWEPIDNLKCPDIIQRFREKEKNRRKRRNTAGPSTQTTPASKRSRQNEEPLLVEDIEVDSTTETISSADSNSHINGAEIDDKPVQPKGFERELPIEAIIGSCTDDNEKLWFFIKWKGCEELELIDANEIEEKAPRELCVWYRERLYHKILTSEQEKDKAEKDSGSRSNALIEPAT